VLVAGIGAFDQEGADIGLINMSTMSFSGTSVVCGPANFPSTHDSGCARREYFHRVVQHLDLMLQPFAVIGKLAGGTMRS